MACECGCPWMVLATHSFEARFRRSRTGTGRGACARMSASKAKLSMNENILKDIDRRVREVLAQSPAADLEKNLRALLSGFFSRLDLVTREEFDVQRQVLLRTREKLAQLEARVAELERTAPPPAS